MSGGLKEEKEPAEPASKEEGGENSRYKGPGVGLA